ncbi:MAG: haloacid dehalogenase type II [Chloroflexota bacterium]|nr:haloacid dehalogenase type II [Chloroflexota bacterium]
MIQSIEAIGFDAYGTLFDVGSAGWAAPEVMATARTKQLQYSWLMSLMGQYADFHEVTRAAIEYALEQHHTTAGPIEEIMAAQTRVPIYAEVPEALDLCAPRRLAIVSNGHPDSLEAMAANAGIRDRLDLLVSAHNVRIYKPAPAVYQLAADAFEVHFGVPKDRWLFVSSNGWDAAGAAQFGLRVAWVNRSGLPRERIGGEPEVVVPNLLELAEQLS